MGYIFTIGEFKAEIDPAARSARPSAVGVAGNSLGAPPDCSGAPNSHKNCVRYRYIAWEMVAGALGLTAVFNGDERGGWTSPSSGKLYDGLLLRHAGAAPLTEDHLAAFVAAEERWHRREGLTIRDSPSEVVGGWREMWGPPRSVTEDEWKAIAAQIRWLVWWTEWALNNCNYPTLANT